MESFLESFCLVTCPTKNDANLGGPYTRALRPPWGLLNDVCMWLVSKGLGYQHLLMTKGWVICSYNLFFRSLHLSHDQYMSYLIQQIID